MPGRPCFSPSAPWHGRRRPAAILALAALHRQGPSPEGFSRPPPWPWHVFPVMFWCHVGVTVAAAVAAVRRVAGRKRRVLVCLALLLWLGVTGLVAVTASMAVSGRYL